MRSYDLGHVPLLVLCLLPLAAAVVVAVIALVALSGVVEVVGRKIVGYPHTLRAVEQD